MNSLSSVDAHRKTIFYPKTDITPNAVYPALRLTRETDAALFVAVIHDICQQRWARPPLSVTHITTGGTFHLLFIVEVDQQRFIIRLNRLPHHGVAWGMHLDHWAYQKLLELGLLCPQSYVVDTSRTICSTDYQIMTYVEGQPLTAFENHETQAMNSVLLQAVGRYVARVHSVKLRGYGPLSVETLLGGSVRKHENNDLQGRYPEHSEGSRLIHIQPGFLGELAMTKEGISSFSDTDNKAVVGIHSSWADYLFLRFDEHLASCQNIGAVTIQEVATIKKLFDKHYELFACPQPVWLHGDLGNHNMLSRDGLSIAALVDWEDSMSGDPIFDIAFWGTFFKDHMLQDFLVGYKQIQRLPDDFFIRYWLYYLRIALSKTVHRARFGYVDKPGRQQASLRIQKSLRIVIDSSTFINL